MVMSLYPVSVVIPTYNRGKLLKRAIDSVNGQTVKCAEMIIVDDGSTDSTSELLDKHGSVSKIPIRVYKQENKGPAAARNFGLKMAEEPVIAFLDSDDHWHKRKIEYQYKQMLENPEYLISHTKEKWLRLGQHLNQKKKHIPQQGDIFTHCLELCAVGMSTVMVRKELFEKVGLFDESLQCCEDYDLWLRVSCNYKFLLVDFPLTVKEGGREDQVSFKYRLGMDRFRIYSLQQLLESNRLNEKQHYFAFKEFEKKIMIFANGCKKHGKEELGKHFFELIPVYRDKFSQRFPGTKEHFNA